MKELYYVDKKMEKLPPAPVYVPGCDDVHQEVDRNGMGGMFL